MQDNEGFPPGAERLRDCIVNDDAFVISSPEYNASMPGLLKNTIDWVSRFEPQPFNEKHGLLLSASPSMVGGNRGAWALRVPFEHLGARGLSGHVPRSPRRTTPSMTVGGSPTQSFRSASRARGPVIVGACRPLRA